jgi:phage terminase large subunit-like protein
MPLSKDEELEYIALLEKEQAARARNSLADYSGMMLGFDQAAHHLVLIEALEEIERGDLDLLIVNMPPGSAKSLYGSVAFPAWYLGRNPTKMIIGAANTSELADGFGRKARNLIGNPDHQRAFPGCMLAADNAAASRWATSKGGEYFGTGIGGAITGRRADLAIIDDPVKSREEADSETIREKQWAWWKDDLQTRLKPGAGVVVIMTRWHEDDLGGRILRDLKERQSSARVKVLKVAMEALPNDPIGREVGAPLWPEWFTPLMIENAKSEPRTWSALYQQEPRPEGGGEFKEEWLCYYKNHPSVGSKVILVDPSSGKKSKRKKAGTDFTSMWVVGVGADGNDYVIDGIRDRLNLAQRTEALFDLVRRHKPSVVGYEEYGLQADIEHIQIEQERQSYRFRIIPLGGSVNKEDRIRRMIPSFQKAQTWLPQSMVRQMADGVQRDIIAAFKDEYLSFPVGAHDDAMDCLARKEEAEMRRYLTSPEQLQNRPAAQPWRPGDKSMGFAG